MLRKENHSQNIFRTGKMLLFTTLSAILVTAVLLLITALLLDKMGLAEKQVQLLIYGVYIVSGLAAGFLAGKWQRSRKFLWGALAGLVWMAVVLVVSLCMNGTAVEVKELFPAFACMVGGGMLGGMLA